MGCISSSLFGSDDDIEQHEVAYGPQRQNLSIYPRNDFELVVKLCVSLENILTTQYGAEGSGLGEKMHNVEKSLPPTALNHLRPINKIRNRLVHQGRVPDNRQQYINHYEAARSSLQSANNP